MHDTDITSVSELLAPERIHTKLPTTSKEDVINLMVDMLEGHPRVKNLEGVRRAVFQREELMSTGVGKELALPHAKTSCVMGPVACFAMTARPIEFEAMDDRPVRLVFLLVGTEDAGSHHIKLLSRISRLMSNDDFRTRLLRKRTPEDVLSLFKEAEQNLRNG